MACQWGCKLLEEIKVRYDDLIFLDVFEVIFPLSDNEKLSLQYCKKNIDFYLNIGFIKRVPYRLHGEVLVLREIHQKSKSSKENRSQDFQLQSSEENKSKEPSSNNKDEHYFTKILELTIVSKVFPDLETTKFKCLLFPVFLLRADKLS